MGILEKDSNKVKVEIKINNYKENFDSKLTWEDEVDLEIDNILNNYNLVKAFVIEAEKFKWTYEK